MSGSIKRKPSIPPKIDGYSVVEILGSGSYSTVYKAVSKVY